MTEKEALFELSNHCIEFRGKPKELDIFLNALNIGIHALEEIWQYREIGTVENFERLAYLKKRYEDETYDYCGEYGANKCELKDRVEKLQEYEAVGTVEECRAAVERQKPKKPKDEVHVEPEIDEDGAYVDADVRVNLFCPTCGELVGIDDMCDKFCRECGQAIDGGGEE